MSSRKARCLWIALLIFAAWLVSFPRFDRQDLGPIKLFTGKIGGEQSLGDAVYYTAYVEYFRGRGDIEKVDLPFRYRPLVPFLASVLPVESPMTALNVLNLAALYVTLLFLFLLLGVLGFDFTYRIGGCFMYVVSFPVFYMSTTGYLDTIGMCLLAMAVYFVYRDQWFLAAATIAVGALVKEIVVLAIPVGIACAHMTGSNRGKLLARSLLLVLGFVAPTAIVRLVFRDAGNFYWVMGFQSLFENLRLRAMLSLLLSFGIPGVISMVFLAQYNKMSGLVGRRLVVPLLAGMVFTVLLVAYSMLTAYTDGRFVWPMTIFSIPPALWVLRYGPMGRRSAHPDGWRKRLSPNLNSDIM